MLDLITNKLFRKWLTVFLKRIASKHPDTFKAMLDDLELKPLVKKVIIDRYVNGRKWESFDYIDDRTARCHNKIFLDKFIDKQK